MFASLYYQAAFGDQGRFCKNALGTQKLLEIALRTISE